jgi:hypothetical protein
MAEGQVVLVCPVVTRAMGATTPVVPLPNEPHCLTLINPLG